MYAKVRFEWNGRAFNIGDLVDLPAEYTRKLKRLLSETPVEKKMPNQAIGEMNVVRMNITEKIKKG